MYKYNTYYSLFENDWPSSYKEIRKLVNWFAMHSLYNANPYWKEPLNRTKYVT